MPVPMDKETPTTTMRKKRKRLMLPFTTSTEITVTTLMKKPRRMTSQIWMLMLNLATNESTKLINKQIYEDNDEIVPNYIPYL